jgi:phosphoglycerate kinase
MKIQNIQDAKDLKGKRVLVRVDFNVPIKAHKVENDYRIKRALPTIEYLKKKEAKIILISHIGRDPKKSLRPIANYFNNKKNFNVGFIPTFDMKNAATIIDRMQNKKVVMLQNLRRHEGEVANDKAFAKELASLADVYVNDAFAVSHRKHASIVGIPKYIPGYAGFLLQDELSYLDMALKPPRPFLFVLGGAKIATKMPLLKKFASIADTVFVGGAIANDLLKAQGVEVGKSLVDESAKGIRSILSHDNIMLPQDVLIQDGKSCSFDALRKNDVIVDVGIHTRKSFEDLIQKHSFVIMNGPIGWYEKGFDVGTRTMLKALAKSKAQVIVGGGDTVSLIDKMRLHNSFLFVSTGGGAMLDYLSDGKLPGIEAIKK